MTGTIRDESHVSFMKQISLTEGLSPRPNVETDIMAQLQKQTRESELIAKQFEDRMEERDRKRLATKTMLTQQPDKQVLVSANGQVNVF